MTFKGTASGQWVERRAPFNSTLVTVHVPTDIIKVGILEWLKHNCGGSYDVRNGSWDEELDVFFELEVDATFFSLQWS